MYGNRAHPHNKLQFLVSVIGLEICSYTSFGEYRHEEYSVKLCSSLHPYAFFESIENTIIGRLRPQVLGAYSQHPSVEEQTRALTSSHGHASPLSGNVPGIHEYCHIPLGISLQHTHLSRTPTLSVKSPTVTPTHPGTTAHAPTIVS